MRNYLTFDNKDSRDFGVYINGQGTFRAPARSYNVLNIPGRNGDLLGFGSKLENVEITYRAFIYTNFDANIAALRSFLLSHVGYFKLTDSYHPDEYRLAYYKGPFVPDVVANNGAGSFDLTFVCKPQRFLNSGEEVTTLTPAGAEQHTYQGEIVNFSTLAGDKITSARADFHPIQDLHGYDHPWPAGGGKNICPPDIEQGGFTETGMNDNTSGIYTTRIRTVGYIPVTAGSTVVVTASGEAGYYTVSGYAANDYETARIQSSSWIALGNSCSINSGVSYIRIAFRKSNSSNITPSNISNVMCEYGSTPTTFSPYSNICPISGRTGLSVYRTGKNLLDTSSFTSGTYNDVTLTRNTDGSIALSGTASATINLNGSGFTLPAGTYTLSGSIANNQLYLRDSSTNTVLGESVNGNVRNFTISESKTVYLRLRVGGSSTVSGTVKPQLELGSTETTYEPYSGTTYAVDWTSESGTVYGGTLDVVSGVLTVDRATITLNGSEAWGIGAQNQGFYTQVNDLIKTTDYKGKIISDKLKTFSRNSDADYKNGEYGITGYYDPNNVYPNQNWIYAKASGIATANDFKTWLSSNPITVVYELATPLTYQLTAQEIEALADNYMWSDVGQVTVTVTDAMTIENPTLFDAKPLLRVYGAGTLTLGGQTITISTADVYTDIDCEMMDCFKDTVSKNGNVSFSGYDFPVIPPGRNVITMDGVTQVDITPRWWAA